MSLTSRFPRRQRRWCDKDAFTGNLNGHEPLRYPQHRGHTVAIFRRPGSRLVSECTAIDMEFRRAFGDAPVPQPAPVRRRRGIAQWLNGSVYSHPFLREFLYSHGFSHAAIAQLSEAWNSHRDVTTGQHRLPLAECAAVRGMRGCQTKMVLGVPCAAPFPLNDSLLHEAQRRVRNDFLFVGLTERFDESVCLFHARLGGKRPVASQFLNTRPRGIGVASVRDTDSAPSSVITHAWHTEYDEVSALPRDIWDDALYSDARLRFEADCAKARGVPHGQPSVAS